MFNNINEYNFGNGGELSLETWWCNGVLLLESWSGDALGKFGDGDRDQKWGFVRGWEIESNDNIVNVHIPKVVDALIKSIAKVSQT